MSSRPELNKSLEKAKKLKLENFPQELKETVFEDGQEKKKEIIQINNSEETLKEASPQNIVAATNASHQTQELEKEIEKNLEEGLEEIYMNMSPEIQKEFRARGEETAKKISLLLTDAKTKLKKIIKLIKNWLSLIPGVNKYFLEQEAKIKADKIFKLKD